MALLLGGATANAIGWPNPWHLQLPLHPATGGDSSSSLVCLTLSLHLPPSYPTVPPEICIVSARGLSDSRLDRMQHTLQMLASSRLGSEMLFEIFDTAKELLTENNFPCCHCAICLCDIQPTDKLFRTPCYHYYHKCCLSRYLVHTRLQHEERDATVASRTIGERQQNEQFQANRLSSDWQQSPIQVLCPVCRETLTIDPASLSTGPLYTDTQDELDDVSGNTEKEDEEWAASLLTWRRQQQRFRALFDEQKDKEGHIDPAENPFVLTVVLNSPQSSEQHREEQEHPEPKTCAPRIVASVPMQCGGKRTAKRRGDRRMWVYQESSQRSLPAASMETKLPLVGAAEGLSECDRSSADVHDTQTGQLEHGGPVRPCPDMVEHDIPLMGRGRGQGQGQRWRYGHGRGRGQGQGWGGGQGQGQGRGWGQAQGWGQGQGRGWGQGQGRSWGQGQGRGWGQGPGRGYWRSWRGGRRGRGQTSCYEDRKS
uniref:E3 ubiquitin-protein ligase RNF25-like isoform X3 n=1 Tax=Myxine glutinosa TaxID=7769 RepID=UPI00358E1C99